MDTDNYTARGIETVFAHYLGNGSAPGGVDPAQIFIEAARAAEAARAVIVSRLAAIKVEKKETISRLTAEARAIRLLLGRRKPRAPKAAAPKKTRKARITGIEAEQQA